MGIVNNVTKPYAYSQMSNIKILKTPSRVFQSKRNFVVTTN